MNRRQTVTFYTGLLFLSNVMGFLVYALLKWER